MRNFSELFQGRADCFGIYRVLEKRSDGKQKGKGITYPNSRYPDRVPTDKDWEDHLKGIHMMGVVPVLPNGTCSWFAIDVDDYSISQKALAVKIEKLSLPLVTCRSKSGGAHLYCFVDGFIEASLAMKLGKKWAADLGFPKSEIFPKQSKFDDDKAMGNWIILPYYGNSKAVDFCITADGEKLTLEDFVQWGNAKQIRPEEAGGYLKQKQKTLKEMSDREVLDQSPPCVVTFLADGVPEGGRNNTMFHMAVYYQKLGEGSDDNQWKDKLQEFNAEHVDPALTYEELNQIIKNTSPIGKYQYLCQQQPMCGVCDKEICIKRKFGVGEDRSYYGEVEVMSMIKIDSKPPLWIPRINGTDIEMDTDTLLAPRKFRMAIADSLNILIPQMKQGTHDKIIGPIMKDALQVEAMDELTIIGKVMECFNEWIQNMVTKSKDIKDIEKGMPFYKKEESAIYFRGSDFIKEYRRNYKDNTTERGLWAALRKNGFASKQVKLNKRPISVWVYLVLDEEVWFDLDVGGKF